jgi:hypothetical protein
MSAAELHGCLALEEGDNATQLTDTADWPVLHRTRLQSTRACKDLFDHVRRLDRECYREKRDAAAAQQKYEDDLEEFNRTTQFLGTDAEQRRQEQAPKPPPPPPDCSDDDAIALLGRKICDGYEGVEGAWKDMFLAECDCLKRDHVPELADVVALCREKVGRETRQQQDYEAALAAGSEDLRAALTAPEVTVSAQFCDKLERREAVLVSAHRKMADPFNHLLARYLVRRPWVEVLSKDTDGVHPSCLYKPCRSATEGMHHVSYPDLMDRAPCTNISLCEASINVQYASGAVSTFDNIFRVACSGGTNCSGDTAHSARCKNGGLCQPDGSCLCPKRPKEFTGPRCEVEVKPDPNYRPPEDNPADPEDPTPTPTPPKPVVQEKKDAQVPWILVLGIGLPVLLLILVGLYAATS